QYTNTGFAATTLTGRDGDGGLTSVGVGSGLSLASGTLSATDASASNELQTLSFNGTTNYLTITPAGNSQLIIPYREFGCARGSVVLTNTNLTNVDIDGQMGTPINTTINTVSNTIQVTKGGNYMYTVSGYIYNESTTTTGVVINLYRSSNLTDWTYATVPASGGLIPFSFTGFSDDGFNNFNVKAQAANSFSGGLIYINQFKMVVQSLY
ncbi:MAG: hypothetical protein KBA02_07710, partial [Paludibacteraceae bacterium]|nr:hypothetical protein [Paludibacteraceae bacterium]